MIIHIKQHIVGVSSGQRGEMAARSFDTAWPTIWNAEYLCPIYCRSCCVCRLLHNNYTIITAITTLTLSYVHMDSPKIYRYLNNWLHTQKSSLFVHLGGTLHSFNHVHFLTDEHVNGYTGTCVTGLYLITTICASAGENVVIVKWWCPSWKHLMLWFLTFSCMSLSEVCAIGPHWIVIILPVHLFNGFMLVLLHCVNHHENIKQFEISRNKTDTPNHGKTQQTSVHLPKNAEQNGTKQLKSKRKTSYWIPHHHNRTRQLTNFEMTSIQIHSFTSASHLTLYYFNHHLRYLEEFFKDDLSVTWHAAKSLTEMKQLEWPTEHITPHEG